MFLVAGVDALGAVADKKVLLPLHTGFALQYGDAYFFGGARVNRGFIHDDGTFFHVTTSAGGSADERGKVGDVGFVNRGGHGYDDYVGLAQQSGVVGIDRVYARLHFLVAELEGGVSTVLTGFDFVSGDVETYGADFFAEFYDKGQSDIAEADDGKDGFFH